MNHQVYIAYYYGCLILQHNQPLSPLLAHLYKLVDNSYLRVCSFLKSYFDMCGFDSDFSQSVCQRYFRLFQTIKADSKNCEILMPNVLIDLGFLSYRSTYLGGNEISCAGVDGLTTIVIAHCKEASFCVNIVMVHLLPHRLATGEILKAPKANLSPSL